MNDLQTFYKDHLGSYIQTFDDSKQGRRDLITCQPITSWLKDWKALKALNERGAGIFMTPNPCSGGRKEEHITAKKYIYVDIDEECKEWALSRQGEALLPPTVVIESKRSYHFWYAIKDQICTTEQWQSAQDGLNQFFHGDLAISSPNEVLRAPNFWHAKNPDDKFLIRLDAYTPEYQWTIEELLNAFPYTPPIIESFKGVEIADNEIEQIKKIPIEDVLHDLGVEVKHGFIWENGEQTSAHVMRKGNFITRFSGKPGSGSTIDAVMTYGNKTKAEAIKWLKNKAGIEEKKIIIPKNSEQSDWIINNQRAPYTWGTRGMDEALPAIRNNHFFVVVAQYGGGKTSLSRFLSIKNSEFGHKVMVIALEEDRHSFIENYAVHKSGITNAEERDRNIPEQKRQSFLQAVDEMNRLPILFRFRDDFLKINQSPTIENIIAMIIKEKPTLVFIDNLGRIESEDSQSFLSDTKIVQTLSNAAMSLNIPIFLFHHYGKPAFGKGKKDDSMIKGSGKIQDESHTLISLERLSEDEKKEVEFGEVVTVMKVSKNRARNMFNTVNIWYHAGQFHDFNDYPLRDKSSVTTLLS